MDVSQQLNQLELNLPVRAPTIPVRRDCSSETLIASRLSESPTGEVRLMESICEWDNMRRALQRVRSDTCMGRHGPAGSLSNPSAVVPLDRACLISRIATYGPV